MRLKDVQITGADGHPDQQSTQELLKAHLRGTGLPWYTDPAKKGAAPAEGGEAIVGGAGDYAAGRRVFARGCIACHSSIQPGDLPELEQKLVADGAVPLPPPGDLPPESWVGKRSEW